MKTRLIHVVLGVIALTLAAIGTITSISTVRAGGAEGGAYLTVDIVLAATGVTLLVLGARRGDRTGEVRSRAVDSLNPR